MVQQSGAIAEQSYNRNSVGSTQTFKILGVFLFGLNSRLISKSISTSICITTLSIVTLRIGLRIDIRFWC